MKTTSGKEEQTCSAWMSKMTTLVGPPRDSGMLDRMRASVNAVATSPSASTCAKHASWFVSNIFHVWDKPQFVTRGGGVFKFQRAIRVAKGQALALPERD